MTAGNYSPKSITVYFREVRFLVEYYPDIPASELKENHLLDYMIYIKTVHQASRSKCKMYAQAVAFFFRHVLKKPYEVPSKLYPRSEFKLPVVLSREEVQKLLGSCESLKQRSLIEVFYSTGIRLEELQYLKMTDIEVKNNRIKVTHGKGKKERYTILSQLCVDNLRAYYRKAAVKPKTYLFEGQTTGKPMHARSIQHAVTQAYIKAGLSHKGHKVHALRHSFATHLLDSGVDIHTIKELLGHSKIETTMVYLHLQVSKRNMLVNPLDVLYQQPNEIVTIEKQKKMI